MMYFIYKILIHFMWISSSDSYFFSKTLIVPYQQISLFFLMIDCLWDQDNVGEQSEAKCKKMHQGLATEMPHSPSVDIK